MSLSTTTHPTLADTRRLPNLWDLAALLCVFGVLAALAHVARGTLAPLDAPNAVFVSLDPAYLPGYALRTTLRMFAAIVASLAFSLAYAAAAAKSRRAALVMIPLLDILQSVPILGFLTFTVVFFMNLFPGKVLGLELAAVFAIFTSQAWNMAFSLYQAFTTLPVELSEAARSFRLTAWQRFWRLEVPFGTPGLVWNTMMSMSGGWFFVVASEAISVGDQTWKLPGIGSYVALALEKSDLAAVAYAILAMLGVILAYDQLLLRPIVAWSAKFRFEESAGTPVRDPWMLRLLRRTHLLRRGGEAIGDVLTGIGGLRLSWRRAVGPRPERTAVRLGDTVFGILLALAVAAGIREIVTTVTASLGWGDLLTTLRLGVYTMARVAVLMLFATAFWVPAGVWIGLRPNWARRAQPMAQFLAAFPANLLFPPFVLLIVHFKADPDIWLSPLMILGTQWYILFNVIAGASVVPTDMLAAANVFQVNSWLWWRRVILPAIFPYYITGALTASGGSWNAAIVAEVASWGDTRLTAHGLGAYIAQATSDGDMAKVVLGVAVMSAFVLIVNRLLWRPLHTYSVRRFTLD